MYALYVTYQLALVTVSSCNCVFLRVNVDELTLCGVQGVQ